VVVNPADKRYVFLKPGERSARAGAMRPNGGWRRLDFGLGNVQRFYGVMKMMME
jgi:hypothetical protein